MYYCVIKGTFEYGLCCSKNKDFQPIGLWLYPPKPSVCSYRKIVSCLRQQHKQIKRIKLIPIHLECNTRNAKNVSMFYDNLSLEDIKKIWTWDLPLYPYWPTRH